MKRNSNCWCRHHFFELFNHMDYLSKGVQKDDAMVFVLMAQATSRGDYRPEVVFRRNKA